MKPSNITILPELAAWFRNHKPEEAAKFEQNLKAAGDPRHHQVGEDRVQRLDRGIGDRRSPADAHLQAARNPDPG